MGHLGFSYIGLIFLLMLMIPNLIWTRYQPEGYDSQGENKILLIFERAGQILVTCGALIFSDLNLRSWTLWSLWLVAAAIFMILYEGWWIIACCRVLSSGCIWEGGLALVIHGDFGNRAYWYSSAASQGNGQSMSF